MSFVSWISFARSILQIINLLFGSMYNLFMAVGISPVPNYSITGHCRTSRWPCRLSGGTVTGGGTISPAYVVDGSTIRRLAASGSVSPIRKPSARCPSRINTFLYLTHLSCTQITDSRLKSLCEDSGFRYKSVGACILTGNSYTLRQDNRQFHLSE